MSLASLPARAGAYPSEGDRHFTIVIDDSRVTPQYETSFMIINVRATVAMIVNYNHNTLILQATGGYENKLQQ